MNTSGSRKLVRVRQIFGTKFQLKITIMEQEAPFLNKKKSHKTAFGVDTFHCNLLRAQFFKASLA